jgi:hypothetical protein
MLMYPNLFLSHEGVLSMHAIIHGANFGRSRQGDRCNHTHLLMFLQLLIYGQVGSNWSELEMSDYEMNEGVGVAPP